MLFRGVVNIRIKKSQLFLLCFLIFGAIGVVIFQKLLLEDVYDQYGRSAVNWSTSVMLSNLIWFFWGIVIANSITVKGKLLPLFYTVVLCFAVFINIDDVFKGVVFSAENTRGGSATFNHLFVASNVVVLFFYCFSSYSGRARLMVSILYLYVLFSLQGRAALFGAISTIFIFWLINSGLSSKLKVIAFFSSVLMISLFSIDFGSLQSNLGSRFSFSSGMDEDISFIYRLQAMVEGVNWLPQQTLFGDPTIFVKYMSGLGSYMHNFLSIWQIFGLPFTIITVFLMYYGTRKFSIVFDKNDPSCVFIFLILVYSIIQLIIAQSILFKVFWFILGVIFSRVKYKKINGVGYV